MVDENILIESINDARTSNSGVPARATDATVAADSHVGQHAFFFFFYIRCIILRTILRMQPLGYGAMALFT